MPKAVDYEVVKPWNLETMTDMRKWVLFKRILLGISLISLFMAPTALGETIRVGVLLPLSGRLAALGGEMERNSFLMAAISLLKIPRGR
ncbi:MAG: ABC transporter substrate-binding protein [Deltaproteobacteria bacterium]|nr:ABC transporter substrate-binding protein [Deltaproteobacteria bacterium]